MQKRNLVLSALIVFILVGVLASRPANDPEPPFKNLKVLSRNISGDDMERVMHSFNSQLGVTCIYCHVWDTVSRPARADFISDAIPAKKIARSMMKMTFRLNKKYFNTTLDGMMSVKPVIWCTTCHHGLAIPVPMANKYH